MCRGQKQLSAAHNIFIIIYIPSFVKMLQYDLKHLLRFQQFDG